MKQLVNKQGFTLIEIIIVLIILGIVAVVMGNLIIYGVQHYLFARKADELSQKSQLALARLNRELIDMTAVTTAAPDQIDYTTPYHLPSCAVDAGCQYSIKRTGRQITLEGINPVVAPQILINGLTTGNGGRVFLRYMGTGGAAWVVTDGFGTLTQIQVQISMETVDGSALPFQATISPRANGGLNAPTPN